MRRLFFGGRIPLQVCSCRRHKPLQATLVGIILSASPQPQGCFHQSLRPNYPGRSTPFSTQLNSCLAGSI